MLNKILVCGAGAIGGYFGGRLAQNSRNDVTFLAHGSSCKNLKENGLRVKSIHGDFNIKINVSGDPLSLYPDFDYIFVCVKLYDTPGLLESIKHLFDDNVISVTLQNGLYGFGELKKYISDRNKLLQGICRISSELKPDGIIYHTALGKIITGEYEDYGKDASKKLCSLLTESGIKTILSDDLKQDIWVKYTWNAIYNSLTALHMKSADSLFDNENTRNEVFKLYDALTEIGGTQGVIFGEKEYKLIITDTMSLPNFQTSAYFDRRNAKKTEVPYLLSFLAELAEKNNLKSNYIHEFIKVTATAGL